MRLRVRLTFAEPWSQVIPEVARQCGLSVDDYCRRAVMLVTKDGIENGEKQDGQHDSASTVSLGDSASPSELPDSDSTVLSDQADQGIVSEASGSVNP